jgi:hypothetical protein
MHIKKLILNNDHHGTIYGLYSSEYILEGWIRYENSKIVSNLLFLKGIKLEDEQDLYIDKELYNILFKYINLTHSK